MVTDIPISLELEAAYQYCEKLAKNHYENFPVASRFLPKKIRRPIAVIYTFARLADDMADEGEFSVEARLAQLQYFWQSLEALKLGLAPNEPVFIALEDVLRTYPNLPLSLFFDLLTAFKQDVVKNEYANFQEILDYCRYSANPIGRLLLHLTDNASDEQLKNADAICTALQLINFLQDLKSDIIDRQRCYLPQDEMRHNHISMEMLINGEETMTIQALINTQLIRTESLLNQGAALGKQLNGLFGFEIRFIIQGGKQIIHTLYQRKSVYTRPVLRVWHWPILLFKALLYI
jgi:squalene synthase HpnC